MSDSKPKDERAEEVINAIEDWHKERLRAQRQADLIKLSFHLGVDIKTLEGYLEAKDIE